MATKQRLDLLLVERGLAPSREKARAMIMAGEVSINGQIFDKPGTQIQIVAEVAIRNKPRFVSRGGEKLAWALQTFGIDVKGKICADVGASTGGFTDCLLQNGAAKVYAIDVGYGQLDYSLRQDTRVVVLERTNARFLQSLEEPVNMVVVDAAFISLKLLLPTITHWLQPQADLVTLIKPQFEAGRNEVGKGGVVKNRDIHIRVIHEILSFAHQQQYSIRGLTVSPLKGPAGNVEFLAWFARDNQVESLGIDHLIASIFD